MHRLAGLVTAAGLTLTGLAAVTAAVTAGSLGPAERTTTPVVGPAAPGCAADALRVRVDDRLTVHVTNTSARTCSLRGAPPVQLVVGRTAGTAPGWSAVDLRPAQSYVQPEPLVPGATACDRPVSGGPAGFGHLTVEVAGESVAVPPPPGVSVISVVNCGVVSAVAGGVVP